MKVRISIIPYKYYNKRNDESKNGNKKINILRDDPIYIII
jgi:hypothetical protein